ncbi:MAG: hypothetical protein C7B43_02550 [Sulfobacillus benefaciens]|uniref:Uncharacterized protein n=1 Tax=Sulfobacillus benefaciens TaxID=453960 RepID=A0A2T2X9Z0_9FIRM|nr:MAG: hypothetical protein C7B43_02550 [Sulfobacillus benefaciens]
MPTGYVFEPTGNGSACSSLQTESIREMGRNHSAVSQTWPPAGLWVLRAFSRSRKEAAGGLTGFDGVYK